MAASLLRAGLRVVVCDPSPAAVAALRDLGADAAATPAELAARPGISAIVSMLPEPSHVRAAYLDPSSGVLAAATLKNLHAPLLVDSSTVDPATARAVSAAIEACDLHPTAAAAAGAVRPRMLDAPVSGGVAAAEAGTLTFMCGGSEAAFAAAAPLLRAMGAAAFRCGASGAGAAAKLVNNAVVGVQMAGVAEGLALAAALGLDPVKMTEVLNASSGRCWASEQYNPCPAAAGGAPASRGFAPGFRTELIVKDLRLAVEEARVAGARVPMSSAARALYERVPPALDFSAVWLEYAKP